MNSVLPVDLSIGARTPSLLSVGARPRATNPRSIDSVANGFETMFLSLLLKEMRSTLEPDSLFPGDQGDVYGSLFDSFMSQHLAQGGGLGIGALVKRQLEMKKKAA
jgi:Rod binding domain-containing protein